MKRSRAHRVETPPASSSPSSSPPSSPRISPPSKASEDVGGRDLGIASFEVEFKQTSYDSTREKNKGWHWTKLKKSYENEGYIDEKGFHIAEGDARNHANLSAPRSRRLPRHFCDVTGFEAQYLDPRSKLRYAHQGVYQHIRLNLESQGISKKYRELRGEITELK